MPMTKQSYWIATANGYYAYVYGDEERDRWTPLGWRVAGEPGPTDFVYLRKDGIEQPAPFAYGAIPTWQELGWGFSPPPEPVDVYRDPVVEQPVPPADQKPPKGKPAAGADKNSEE
jgi:hypothetical protein